MENKEETEKPLKKLIEKIGPKRVADKLGVNLATVYKWTYKEAGKPLGVRPRPEHIIILNQLSKRYRVSGLTVDYMVRM